MTHDAFVYNFAAVESETKTYKENARPTWRKIYFTDFTEKRQSNK